MMKNGVENGKYESWDSTGIIKIEGEFINGRKQGFWTYYKKGAIDTTCTFLTGTAIIQHNIFGSNTFPNPFSIHTKIVFGREISDGSLMLYNIFGQRLKQIEQISGDEVLIQKDDLPGGIYIYEVIEKKQRISYGKVVAE